MAELIEQVLRHGAPFSSRHRIIDTAGKIHLVVVVGDRSYDDDGQVTGTAGFYVDITDEFDADVRNSLDEVVASITERRAVINQATGMLMLAYGVAADRGPVCAGTHGRVGAAVRATTGTPRQAIRATPVRRRPRWPDR